ncbi:tRNA A64-2'-O-ribosylphosphate transferase [[Candida] railenensis]|uniref:tRNA A64-2'-O-ribosylphosphate transferase n=1 Tax=[Candida] railenensis TaxID=45579 RepID=A0A9P0QJW8_9ASCO|nr:tRNA A64-2'-O-ribosylphosphate transferase [[Candida] railenensis]
MDFQSNINHISKELRKDQLSIRNRLQSILYDAYYIESLVSRGIARYPLIPNERCGLWYVPEDKKAESCYFKSTDGHTGQWSFNLRRLNLHLLSIICREGGICIVDSTRKGKKIPDALSKTIPIWCAVLNYIRFGEGDWLRTPQSTISESEHSQISEKISKFADDAVQKGIITAEKLKMLEKPLMPEWYYPGAKSQSDDKMAQYYYVQCVTASKRTNSAGGSQMSIPENSWYYVQGSADDHELWATRDICRGKLTPEFFWKTVVKSNDLIDDYGFIKNSVSDAQLIQKMNELYESVSDSSRESTQSIEVTQVKNANCDTGLSFGKIESNLEYSSLILYRKVVILSETWKAVNIPEKEEEEGKKEIEILQYEVESSKKGSKQLREIFPKLIDLLLKCEDGAILVLCDTGKDLSVVIVLVLLCLKFDLNWAPIAVYPQVDKTLVKQHLGLLSELRKINPSRNSLQSANSYLMK